MEIEETDVKIYHLKKKKSSIARQTKVGNKAQYACLS